MTKLQQDQIITDSFDKGSVVYHWQDCDVCDGRRIFVFDEFEGLTYCIVCGTEI